MKIQNTIYAILLLIPWNLAAQTPALNLQKYWEYRDRLIGNGTAANPGFLVVGAAAGNSIPMSVRDPHRLNNVCDTTGIISWSDATVELGSYIAILATEWKLLNDHGQDLAQTELELFHAMNAYRRLDSVAETLYGQPAAVNGFFIRDDVPWTILNEFDGYGRMSSGMNTFNCQQLPACNAQLNLANECPQIDIPFYSISGLLHDTTYYLINLDPSDTIWHSMSGDQVIGLMMGFKCVEAFVDDGATFNGMNFVQTARAMTHLVVNRIRNEDWFIKDPNGDLVCRGSHFQWLSRPLAKAAESITGFDYSNTVSDAIGTPMWILWQTEHQNNPGSDVDICVPFLTNPFGASSPIQLAPGFGKLCIRIGWGEFNIKNMFILAALGDSWNNKTNFSAVTNGADMQVYDLLHTALYGEPSTVLNKFWWEQFLNGSPCAGPCFMDNVEPVVDCVAFPWTNTDCINPVGWVSTNRWERPNLKNQILNRETIWFGEYPGLDYMLAYNLYHIVYANEINQIYARQDTVIGTFPITQTLPVTGATFQLGSHANPGFSSTYNSMALLASLTPQANINIRAGQLIELLPGTNIQQGAVFDAHIEPYNCNVTYKDQPLPIQERPVQQETIPIAGRSLQLQPRTPPMLPSRWTVFPNPASDKLYLEVPSDWQGSAFQIKITDLLGRVKRTTPINIGTPQVEIPAKDLQAGIHILQVTKGRQLLHQEKLVILK